MTDLNSVIEIGRLTRDISERDFTYTTGGTARLNLSIAVNRSEKRNGAWQDKVSYFDVTVWGKTAENIKPYLGKGKQICINGRLRQDRWESNGQKNSRVVIVAETVQLLGGRDNGAGSGGNYQQPAQQQAPAYNDGRDFPEDIPF